MKYDVATIRAAGFEAKWVKTSAGAPIIIAANPMPTERLRWYAVDANMWKRAKELNDIRQAFDEYTALGEFFSVRI